MGILMQKQMMKKSWKLFKLETACLHFLPKWRHVYESLGEPKQPLKLFKIQPLKLELKPLLEHLKYTHLWADQTLPVIVTIDLTHSKEEKLLKC